MGYTAYLQALLRPLGVYALAPETLSGGELYALGEQLDALRSSQRADLREAIPATAQAEGLSSVAALFGVPLNAEAVAQNRETVSALLRIGSGGASVQALNDTLAACGVPAVVRETQTPQTVNVCFATLNSQPENYAQLCARIESVLPCHLAITYSYHDLTWQQLTTAGWLWSSFCIGSWKQLLTLSMG